MSLTPRQKLIKQANMMLGGGVIKIELTDDHWDLAFDLALSRYRYRSGGSTIERYAFLDLQPDQMDYVLPEDVVWVREILRRNVSGTGSQSGAVFDPFGAAFTNQFLLPAMNSNQLDLVSYELMSGYKELIGRMFGYHLTFTFDPGTKKLVINRQIRSTETVMIRLFAQRPEDVLLNDPFCINWLRDYTVARAKFMLGEIRSKFSSLGGPQGGVTLNGEALKTEATADMERLEEELKKSLDQNQGYGFIIG